jgi:ABC-2 type transport system permease protein
MRAFLLIWRRELLSFFLSPMAYAVMIFFLVIMGYSFWFLASLLAGGGAGVNVMNELFGSFFFWLPMLVIAPMLTMRSLAEERRSGTIETLLTAPVSDAAVVIGKYAGALSFFIAMWLPTAAYVFVLRRFSAESAPVDFGPLLGGYLGALLVGAFYLAIGVFCSALTSNQIIASMSAFALLALIFFAGLLGDATHNATLRHICDYISSVKHMRDFAHGTIDSRPVVFHLTGAAFFIFASIRALDSRHWK